MRKGRSITPRQAGLFIRPNRAGESARLQEQRNITTTSISDSLSTTFMNKPRKWSIRVMRRTQLQGYDASVAWEVKEESKDGREDELEPTGGRLRPLKPAQQLRGGRGPGGEEPDRVLLLHTPPR